MMKVSCPVCQRLMEGQSLQDWPDFPFCSERCKLIDLGRWLGETYRIPAEDSEPTAEGDNQDSP